MTKQWEGGCYISKDLQNEILEGFKKFYDKNHWKYQLIRNAVGIAYVNTVGRSHSFAVISPDGTETTVSRKCQPVNKLRDVKKACRGSIHYEQILPLKSRRGTEIDHCNEGGFNSIFKKWMNGRDLGETYEMVIHNDPRLQSTARKGFKTFKEPLLSEWKTFHKAHAKLQELTPEQHIHLAKKRGF